MEFDKTESKQEMTDDERKVLLRGHVNDLASKKCFDKGSREKKCSCFSCLTGDLHREAVVNHLLEWAAKDKYQRDMDLIQSLQAPIIAEAVIKKLDLKTLSGNTPKILSGQNTKPIKLTYVPTDNDEVNNELKEVYICKHTLGALHKIARRGFIIW